MNLLEKVKAQLDQTRAEAETLVTTAETETRSLTAAESADLTKLVEEIRAFEERISQLETIEKTEADFERQRRKFQKPLAVKESAGDEIRALDLFFHGDGDRSFELETRDLTVGVAGDGPELVPQGFWPKLHEHMIATAAMLKTGVTELHTATGNSLDIPKTTSYSTAAIIAEGVSITESDPQFATVTLDSFKYAFAVQVSQELVQDTRINLVDFLARQGGRALGNGLGIDIVVGDGSSKPNGVVTASTLGVTGATGVSGAPQADELMDLFASVLPEYRGDAAWMMSDATWSGIRKLKDTTNQYLVAPLGAAGRLELLGRPVVIDPNVVDAALNAKSVVFGDFSAYYVRFAGTVRIERSDDYAFLNDLATFKFVMRADGDLVDISAVKHFLGAAS